MPCYVSGSNIEAKERDMAEPDVIVSRNEIGGLGAALTCAGVDRNVPMLEAAGQFEAVDLRDDLEFRELDRDRLEPTT